MADEEKKITEAVEEVVETEGSKAEKATTETETSGTKKKKSAYRRMIEKRIKIIACIVAVLAILVTVFFTCIASYSFSEKAWHVKFDPFHG